MADYYVDHGAYATNIGTTPTWNTPQEGDGTATTASGASSIGSIVFGINCSAGATVTVCGIVFTAVASGATGNQFNVGAALTNSIDNLVTAMNASTTAVGAGVAYGVPQLRNLIFTRNTSGTTLEVMSRVGSTQCNNSINSNWALATASWGTPTITQFTGGTGGCFGWFINPSAIGVSSSIAAAAYGIAVGKPMVSPKTSQAALNEQDFVYVRTASGKSITLGSSVHFNRTAAGSPLNLIFDSATKWTGDSGTGVFTLNLVCGGSSFVYFRPDNSGSAGTDVVWRCLYPYNAKVTFDVSAASATGRVMDGATGRFTGIGMEFADGGSGIGSGSMWGFGTSASGTMTYRFQDCKITQSTYSRSTLPSVGILTLGAATNGVREFDNCDFLFNLGGSPADAQPLLASGTLGGSSGVEVRITRCRFSTNNGLYPRVQLLTSGITGVTTSPFHFVVEGNYNLNIDSVVVGLQAQLAMGRIPRNNFLSFIGGPDNRAQRYENSCGAAYWNPASLTPFPTLAATMPDGTSYSIQLSWYSTNVMSIHYPFSYRTTIYNRLATGARTIDCKFCHDSTLTTGKKQFGVRVSWVDSSNNPQSYSTMLKDDPSSAGDTWANIGSWANYVPKKFSISAASVQQNTEITVEWIIFSPCSSGTSAIFIDPEFVVT